MGLLYDTFRKLGGDIDIRYVPTGNSIYHYEARLSDGTIISADTYEELMRELNEE